jgi:hypothetical protein
MAATRRLRCLPCLLRRPTLSPPYVRRRQPAHPEHSLVAQPIRPTATPLWTPLLSPVAAGGVRSTLAISCEAVPASILAARARGGTCPTCIPCRPYHSAAESFVSFIALFARVADLPKRYFSKADLALPCEAYTRCFRSATPVFRIRGLVRADLTKLRPT